MVWNIPGIPSDLLTDDIEGVRRLAGTVLWYVYNPLVTNEATSDHTEMIWGQR